MTNLNLQHKFMIILCILILILLIKVFIESKYFQHYKNNYKNNNNNELSQLELENTIKTTQNKINKICENSICNKFNIIEHFNTNNDTNTISYLNKNNIIKLQLFYKPSCPHCIKFLPTWDKIINNLPNNITYEDINCEIDIKRATENNISMVPTIILLVDNQPFIYMGNRDYNDINIFLRKNGVNLIQRNFETFNNTNENNKLNQHCPSVTFDKQIDLIKDSYMYQIFNSDGQYGYAEGGNNNKLLTPFMAAYSTIDSYLSSLPDENNPEQNTYKNINECALLYADNIINFGLCNNEELNNILQYQSNIASGTNTYRVDNTNYTTNTHVVNAIKTACGIDIL